ncbi:MAG: hypothetical protein H6922_04255 [Pseudomonadaceae bacterium]|nr:hypothetical protein [Pseudomonadaceae bacterium]
MAEDVLIARAWTGIGRKLSDLRYVEVGGNHPRYLSVTYSLYKQGARGVVVEPNPTLAPLWGMFRPRDVLVRAGASWMKKASIATYWSFRRHTLNTFDEASAKAMIKIHADESPAKLKLPLLPWADILAQGDAPELVVLDTEGLDEKLLKAFPFESLKPTLFCVETLLYDISGAPRKIAPMFKLMEKQGYMVLADTLVNTVFVRRDVWVER